MEEDDEEEEEERGQRRRDRSASEDGGLSSGACPGSGPERLAARSAAPLSCPALLTCWPAGLQLAAAVAAGGAGLLRVIALRSFNRPPPPNAEDGDVARDRGDRVYGRGREVREGERGRGRETASLRALFWDAPRVSLSAPRVSPSLPPSLHRRPLLSLHLLRRTARTRRTRRRSRTSGACWVRAGAAAAERSERRCLPRLPRWQPARRARARPPTRRAAPPCRHTCSAPLAVGAVGQ